MIVHVLGAVHQVEAVERGVRAFRKGDADFVADQGAAERDGGGGEIGAAAQAGEHDADVEGGGRFELDLVVIHHRAAAGDDFGDGVGEVRACARVGLDDGAVGVGADHDERAGVRDFGRGVVTDLDGLADDLAARDVDVGDVPEESRV